jgi:7-keto-8-aminopelargonate synthetase-like enzyme
MLMNTFSSQEKTLTQLSTVLKQMGLIHLYTDNVPTPGRRMLQIDGRQLLNFTSCSYLGLEADDRLRQGAVEKVQQYGVQFDCSRAYISLYPYEELENLLAEIFGKPVVVTTSVTSAHLSCMPVLIGNKDAIILDQQVHSSVQMAVKTVQADGVHVETIRHNRLDYLENRVKKLSQEYGKVWYMVDGVYSMSGDLMPIGEVNALMDQYEQFHLYVDDAHGMSWTGKHGAGAVLSKAPFHPKMMLVTSLGKAFGSSGGVAVFPDEQKRNAIRTFGKTLIFTSPLTPPVLGAAIASARIHLSDQIYDMQSELHHRIQYFQDKAQSLSLPVTSPGESPVCFVRIGKPEMVMDLCQRLKQDGILTNPAIFPSVPYNQAGVRILLSRAHAIEDIERLLTMLADALQNKTYQEKYDFESA